jgi:predicted nucleic acid-binding Zn ribbon protein
VSSEVVALVVGTVLGVGALAFVLYPLFFAGPRSLHRRDAAREAAEESAIVALREIEFDRATGKLSDSDYAELRAAYAGRALRELRAEKTPDIAGPIDPIEARVRAYRMTHRECPTCGLRPEPDAIYCSTCGTFLDRVCPACSAPITESGATFCSSCGEPLSRRTAAAL